MNVPGTCGKGIFLANVREATIRNIQVTGYAGSLINVHNVTGAGLHGAATIDVVKTPEPVPAPSEPYRLH